MSIQKINEFLLHDIHIFAIFRLPFHRRAGRLTHCLACFLYNSTYLLRKYVQFRLTCSSRLRANKFPVYSLRKGVCIHLFFIHFVTPVDGTSKTSDTINSELHTVQVYNIISLLWHCFRFSSSKDALLALASCTRAEWCVCRVFAWPFLIFFSLVRKFLLAT